MRPGEALRALLSLALLAGIGAGGWFAGSEFLAEQGGQPPPLIVESQNAGNDLLLLGSSGLSPFGHPEGLRGRQVLVGRTTAIDGDRLRVSTGLGEATILIGETTFLLRLSAISVSAIEAGAAVAIFVGDDGADPLVVESALVLPSESRPVLNPSGGLDP